MMISVGNFFAHTFMFNIKGSTWYNPRTATAVILFVPIAIWFFITVRVNSLATYKDCLGGVSLGIVLNYLGIVKLIDWMADRNTTYVFGNYQLRPVDRGKF